MKSYTKTRIERCPVANAISAIFCPFQRDIRDPRLTAGRETQYQSHNLYCTYFKQDQPHRLSREGEFFTVLLYHIRKHNITIYIKCRQCDPAVL